MTTVDIIKKKASEIEIDIIRAFINSKTWVMTISEIKKGIGKENQLKDQEVKYYVEELMEKGLVDVDVKARDEVDLYSLTREGRAFWMEKLRPEKVLDIPL